MSATTITKNCAINIDHNLGRSAGELSACWVYLKDKDGRLLGLEGAAYIYTTDRKLVPLWTVIFYGGKTLERHMELYNAQRPHLDSRTRRLIRQAIEVDLIREKMLGAPPKDGLLGLVPHSIILDDLMDIKVQPMANYDDQLDAYKYAMTCALTSGEGAVKTSITSDGRLIAEAVTSQTSSPDPRP